MIIIKSNLSGECLQNSNRSIPHEDTATGCVKHFQIIVIISKCHGIFGSNAAFIAKPLFRSRLTATLRQFTSGRKEKTARNYLEKLSESDYTGKRILLVEDNELNREIAGEILQMTGTKVETAENGKIAVEKVEASPKGSYDLIFMDIQMPVMNGYEATAAIRSLPGAKGKLPIVAMTANAFAEDVQLAKNTGMNGHIAKPLDMNKLNDVLKNWL